MKPFMLATFSIGLVLVGCSETTSEKKTLEPSAYQVADAKTLQARFDQLNTDLASNFKKFKQVEHIAFSHQLPLDTSNLKTLNMHLVASTSLKPTKVAYCDLMNTYFVDMYRLGHHNLALLKQVKLPNTTSDDLSTYFSSSEQFYNFIMERYTTYKQVQQVMGYGCNLKAALS